MTFNDAGMNDDVLSFFNAIFDAAATKGVVSERLASHERIRMVANDEEYGSANPRPDSD